MEVYYFLSAILFMLGVIADYLRRCVKHLSNCDNHLEFLCHEQDIHREILNRIAMGIES